MAAGFNSPQILFLNTWDAPERDYMAPLFQKLRERGYTRLVEPCSGAFVMPLVAVESGWPTAQLFTSDVSLFSALCGYTFAGKPIEGLGVKIDGEPIKLPGTSILDDAVEVMYQQLVLRMEQRPSHTYWNEMRHDLASRADQHRADIARVLAKLAGKMAGTSYEPKDVWEHLAEVQDDPHTVISVNPPTYKGGFEKFYDTGGRLTWDEPRYEVFDASVDVYRLMEQMQGKAALMLCQQQQEPGKAAKSPVYARYLSPGQQVYIVTNRPDEVVELAGGLKVSPMPEVEMARLNVPIVSPTYEFDEESTVELMTVGAKEAAYYRDLWMHKLDFRAAGSYVAVVVDKQLVGLLGYDPGPILRPYNEKWKGAMLMTFAVGAPHDHYRLTRLVTMVALNWRTIEHASSPHLVAMTEQVITVELTRHPEAKGLRGLMKMASRVSDPKYGNRLVYQADPVDESLTRTVQRWLQLEQKYREQRRSA